MIASRNEKRPTDTAQSEYDCSCEHFGEDEQTRDDLDVGRQLTGASPKRWRYTVAHRTGVNVCGHSRSRRTGTLCVLVMSGPETHISDSTKT